MSRLLENLNGEQTEAVTHTSGPLLIVAGAGTGKTTVITRRIAYLIEQKLAKHNEVLALTFTEKAAGEMQERVDLLLPLGYYDMWISTFHSFCERILKYHALDIGLPNDFKLLDTTSQWIFIYKNFDKFDLDYYRPLGDPSRFISALITHFSRCKDELISPGSYLDFAQGLRLATDSPSKAKRKGLSAKKKNISPKTLALSPEQDETEIARLEELANAFHTYQKLLLDNNYLDFGDLINYSLDLFTKRPKILKYYQNLFKFIMVDEFQDTNFAQFQLIKLLAGNHNNLAVVGDDDQSIYKFRGASVSNILKFREEYKTAKQITLTQNYRSCQNILDLAYNFIQANNPDRLEVKLKINKRLEANLTNQDGSKTQGTIEVLEGADLSQELNSVVKKILGLKELDLEASWNDFAVLIRANSAADELLPVLQHHGIPFVFLANNGLFKKPIITNILSYLRLVDNAKDSKDLYHILRLPKFRLSHFELSALLELAKQKTLSLYEALVLSQTLAELSTEAKTKINLLQDTIKKHEALTKEKNVAEIFILALNDIGLTQTLKEDSREAAEDRELVDQFYKKIETFEQQNDHKSLHDFLEDLNLQLEAGSLGEIKFDPNLGPESLKVLTVHAAKGLEFKYVFIINLVDQRFPTREKRETIQIPDALIKDILPEGDFHLQEERRLFYVALTRAKNGLFFTWAKDYGGKTLKKPSLFLLETKLIPSEKINKATGKVVFGEHKPKLKQIYQKLPNTFSYTNITDFESCPLKYKYQHYLKLPMPGSHHQSFGNTIHKTFEQFLKLYKNQAEQSHVDLFGKKDGSELMPEFKILSDFYQKNWIDDWYQNKTQKEEYRSIGQNMLKVFYDSLEKQKPKPKYIEQFFKLKLGTYDFVGKIDRADLLDSGINIIDYKTGKTPKQNREIDQLYVYQWAMDELFKEKVAGLYYWYLQDNILKEETPASEEKIGALKGKLLPIVEEMVECVKFDLFKEKHKKVKDHECKFEYLD